MAVASRTDRGVSARANALVVWSDLPGRALLRALNGIAPEFRFSAAARVDEAFRVRRPRWREYRYFLPATPDGYAGWDPILARFRAGTFDARSFARGVPTDRPCWRTVDEIERLDDAGPVLRLRASGFLWGMVRKIVAATRLVADGKIPLGRLDRALRGVERLTLPMAAPEPLVLWEVFYGLPWEIRSAPATRHQLAWRAEEAVRLSARARFLPELFEDAPGNPSGR